MKTIVLSIPDDPAAVPAWLERQLVGPNLSQLVAELEVVHGSGDADDLSTMLGTSRAPLLVGGFARVPRSVVKSLLTSPALLLDLQAEVMEYGGDYWTRLMAGDEPLATPRLARRSLGWLRTVGLMAATAAAVLVGVAIWNGVQPPPATTSGWGLAKVKSLPPTADRRAVLNTLANLAGEWDKKQPTDEPAMSERILAFRKGCNELQRERYRLPLATDDRDWLGTRCLAWSEEIEGTLRDLERTKDVNAAAAAMKATVGKMQAELRQRAA